METESYQKTGRGGAGNFYSKHDIEEATKHTAEVSKETHNDLEDSYVLSLELQDGSNSSIFQLDLEAQSQTGRAPIESSENLHSDYTISGRGGAGNFWRKEDIVAGSPSSSDTPISIKPSTIPNIGYSGRGGIGNIRSGEVEKLREDMEARAAEARQRAHDEVVRDVEMGLKMPERAHLGAEKLE